MLHRASSLVTRTLVYLVFRRLCYEKVTLELHVRRQAGTIRKRIWSWCGLFFLSHSCKHCVLSFDDDRTRPCHRVCFRCMKLGFMADISRKRLLLVVAKAPARGQTKTRLGALIGLDAAADLYACLLGDVIDIARQAAGLMDGLECGLAYWPQGSEALMQAMAPDFQLVLQCGEALGDRLHHVIVTALANGYAQTAVLSSDTPFVDPAELVAGFRALDNGADIALGPCDDGGYYVLHTRAPVPELLVPITMSTSTVFADTLAAARKQNLRIATLAPSADIDTPDDLHRVLTTLHELPEQVAPRTRAWLVRWQLSQAI